MAGSCCSIHQARVALHPGPPGLSIPPAQSWLPPVPPPHPGRPSSWPPQSLLLCLPAWKCSRPLVRCKDLARGATSQGALLWDLCLWWVWDPGGLEDCCGRFLTPRVRGGFWGLSASAVSPWQGMPPAGGPQADFIRSTCVLGFFPLHSLPVWKNREISIKNPESQLLGHIGREIRHHCVRFTQGWELWGDEPHLFLQQEPVWEEL